ncbi:MAG: L,D-transpeptidase family protein [Chitinophagaceae bacterium]|nr:L,D-transpeptidase family protein [Chitinophagaceae bacterium]
MKTFRSITSNCTLLFLTFIIACQNDTSSTEHQSNAIVDASKPLPVESLIQELQHSFDSASGPSVLLWKGDTVSHPEAIQKFYRDRQFQPVWLNAQGLYARTFQLFDALDSLYYEGLQPAQYQVTWFRQQAEGIKSGNITQTNALLEFETGMTLTFFKAASDMVIGRDFKSKKNKDWMNKNDSLFDEVLILNRALKYPMQDAFTAMRPDHPWYIKFRNEFIHLDALKKMGGLKPIQGLRDSIPMGDSLPGVADLRKRLYQEINWPKDTLSPYWNDDVLQSVKKFQHLHQLKPTGKLDTTTLKKLNAGIEEKMQTLALNMERMRWLGHDFEQPYIWVDIPKMEMDYYEKDSVQFNMRVVVGRPGRATPTLDTRVENIVFSPPWIVPPTIMREEVVPGIARRGGAYLARRGLRAYDRRGRPVSASAINSKNFRSFSIGQSPGYNSSLGEVKFNMPNPWSIYMHDTPHREDFPKAYRAFSSGCVRVQKPKEFAAFLLRNPEQYSYEKIDSICKLRRTIFVPMKRKVNVHFVYLTNGIDSAGNVMYLKDVYGLDKKYFGQDAVGKK